MTHRDVHQVFISHATAERAVFQHLVQCLENRIWALSSDRELRLSVFDPYRQPAGRRLSEELLAAITSSSLCIFVATARSLASAWCGAEMGACWGQQKKVVIYMAEPEAVSIDQLPPTYADLRHATDEPTLFRTLEEYAQSDLARTRLRSDDPSQLPTVPGERAVPSDRTVIGRRRD